MRILHTADWHLCDRLGRLNRTADLQTRVEKVAAYCEEHAVEILLIAGDIFYERATDEEIADSFKHIHRTFQPFFDRGGTILAITGNHDDDAQIQLVRSGLSLAAPLPSGGRFQRGRLYLQNGLTCGQLESPSGERLQVVMVPYPRQAHFDLPETYYTREEEHRLIQHRLAEWVAAERNKESFDKTIPTVLMAHLHVRGANLNKTLFRFSNPSEVQVEPADLKAGWAYVALGHIHLPQAIDGIETLRYPGPLDRLDFGEKDDERGVLLLDIGPTGIDTPPKWLPLEPTPMHEIDIVDPDVELPLLAERYPDRERAIVKIQVTQNRETQLSRDEIARKLRAIFPNLFQLNFLGEEAKADENSSLGSSTRSGKDFSVIVREYLTEQLASDSDRVELLALCETFLADEHEGAAS